MCPGIPTTRAMSWTLSVGLGQCKSEDIFTRCIYDPVKHPR